MGEYLVICVLFIVIIVQIIIYGRERFRLYEIIRGNKPESGGITAVSPSKKKSDMRGHRRAFIKWRNGGERR